MCMLTVNFSLAGESVKPIPAGFNGTWHESLAECASSTPPTLLIGKNGFKSHGMTGKLRAVVSDLPDEVAFIAEITDEDHQKWLKTFHYKLSANGKSMKDVIDDPELAQTLVKCSTKK